MTAVMVSIVVMRGESKVEAPPHKRPVRRMPDGFAAAVYKKKAFPLYEGNFIDLNDQSADAEDCGYFKNSENIKYARRSGQAVAPAISVRPAEPVRSPLPGVTSLPPSTVALQTTIIDAAPDARLTVDAGPGTGKTHVACLRVAALVAKGISPSRIWIISFTRTAVHEIRNRLAAALENPSDASSVRIATLDSHAWAIQSGFSKEATLTGTYDESILQTTQKIISDEEVRDYLHRVRHLIIDEGQDIVGPRAKLALAMIEALSDDCGVTFFADEAQAIYGFTEDEIAEASDLNLIAELKERGFSEYSLSRVYRTDSQGLKVIFTDVRRQVLDREIPVRERGSLVRRAIVRLADVEVGDIKELKLQGLPTDSLVLMRQRCDVLLASSYNQEVRHRLRMSGLPPRLKPWIAILLWDFEEKRLTRKSFDALWRERRITPEDQSAPDAAWRLLVETAGESETVIDLHRLREILGRSSPPVIFTTPDYGDHGPILGTIHASKGREAEEVSLYLPPEEEFHDGDQDEEIRVFFVGATRARKRLSVGNSPGRRSSLHDNRVWRRAGKNKLQIEIGRLYDLEASNLVGFESFSSPPEALNAQKLIADYPFRNNLFAVSLKELDWRMSLQTPEKERIAVLSEKVKSDLKEITKTCGFWPPPNFLPHIRSMGLRTIAIRPDHPALEKLHEPWKKSGFLLAPMLTGFSMVTFKEK